ncbi:hypothetical protein BX666DRAFT_1160796 [Dichotomocladium elegans]|nr:hypothetical protein BX666DRAFT_1160796 [Dichotomocladium elegans]
MAWRGVALSQAYAYRRINRYTSPTPPHRLGIKKSPFFFYFWLFPLFSAYLFFSISCFTDVLLYMDTGISSQSSFVYQITGTVQMGLQSQTSTSRLAVHLSCKARLGGQGQRRLALFKVALEPIHVTPISNNNGSSHRFPFIITLPYDVPSSVDYERVYRQYLARSHTSSRLCTRSMTCQAAYGPRHPSRSMCMKRSRPRTRNIEKPCKAKANLPFMHRTISF